MPRCCWRSAALRTPRERPSHLAPLQGRPRGREDGLNAPILRLSTPRWCDLPGRKDACPVSCNGGTCDGLDRSSYWGAHTVHGGLDTEQQTLLSEGNREGGQEGDQDQEGAWRRLAAFLAAHPREAARPCTSRACSARGATRSRKRASRAASRPMRSRGARSAGSGSATACSSDPRAALGSRRAHVSACFSLLCRDREIASRLKRNVAGECILNISTVLSLSVVEPIGCYPGMHVQ